MIQSPFQKQAVSLDQLLPYLILPESTETPQIILSVSPCRSGTTVMLRVMAAMEAQAVFQPLKNILRWHLQATPRQWAVPAGRQQIVYLKETLGPYTMAESTFNPLELLLRAGISTDKLHIWIYGRTPLDCFASWRKWWGAKTSVDYFVASYRTVESIAKQARSHHIPCTTLTYEQFATFTPDRIVTALAQRFGVSFTPSAIAEWGQLPAFGSAASGISQPEEPPIFVTPNIHVQVESASKFSYHSTSVESLSVITAAERQKIQDAGLFELYDLWHKTCLLDLNLAE